ncbi:unnamed protein product [Rhizoctonia solani]|uniref:Spp2/MOS2 G-patch domain-containing protein n=1 Tax=Rhizoctonia solani TaxID=456999 RepID=A0A8H3D4U0_9AGAM|nr:unnamed protein product [Rhizoctonia solani]
MTSNVSFTVRPPPRAFDSDTPETSRPGSASPSDLEPFSTTGSKPKGKRQWESYTADSSDEDEEDTKEMITGFDAMGVQRSDGKSSKPAGPLVIPAQKNRDWHAESMARKRQHQMYVPDGAKVAAGADGSQGGLGTRGKINDGPQFSGLVVTKREEGEDVKMEEVDVVMEVKQEVKEEEPMDEDQRALRALLRGEQGDEKQREIDAITVQDQLGGWAQPKNEVDAFKEDLATRPDEASLADYERIPIELFGEAMLRGMGAGKPAKKSIQPYIPEARPALLGIGAKPRPVDEVDQGKGKKFSRPDKRYIPILKVEKNGSGQSSRRTSRSRSGSPNRGSSRRDRDLDRRDRDRDRDRRDRDYDRDKRRDRDHDRDKRRDYDSDRDRDRRRDKDDDKDRRRDYDDDRDRRRDKDRDDRRDRDRDRDDRRDRDRRR